MGKSSAKGATGDKTTIGLCQGGSRAKDEAWTLAEGQLLSGRVSKNDEFCIKNEELYIKTRNNSFKMRSLY